MVQCGIWIGDLMASRIVHSGESIFTKPHKPIVSKSYIDFIHELPCVVTGRYGVEAAHLSTTNRAYGHTGRGKSQKAGSRWILPLVKEQHERQTWFGNSGRCEMAYWNEVGIDPHQTCNALYATFRELEGTPDLALDACIEILKRARAFSP